MTSAYVFLAFFEDTCSLHIRRLFLWEFSAFLKHFLWKSFILLCIVNDRFFNKFIQYLTSLTPSQRLAVWLKRKGRMLLSMDVMAVWRNRDCALVNRHMVTSHGVHIQVQWVSHQWRLKSTTCFRLHLFFLYYHQKTLYNCEQWLF